MIIYGAAFSRLLKYWYAHLQPRTSTA